MVELQPGETLVNYALGDTARWVVGDVTDGNQTRLLVKPVKAGLSTNLVITTDKRVYVVQAESHKRDIYNAVIAWTYPLDEISKQVEVIEAVNKENADTIVIGVPIDQLNFDYAIKGDQPRWRPVRAFDDGAKVYIEFPKDSWRQRSAAAVPRRRGWQRAAGELPRQAELLRGRSPVRHCRTQACRHHGPESPRAAAASPGSASSASLANAKAYVAIPTTMVNSTTVPITMA